MTTEKKTEGLKFDAKKPLAACLPACALIEIAKVFTFGAKKYGRNNWQYVENLEERYQDALMRHTYEYLDNYKYDKETGLHVLAHMGANVLILLANEIMKERENEKVKSD